MSRIKNVKGNRYNKLLVLSFHDIRKQKSRWNCLCDCGNATIVILSDLTTGNTQSCGCLNKEITSNRSTTHGLSDTSEYHIWTVMKERCLNPNNKSYSKYGGRGITISDEWNKSFEVFLNDVGFRPSDLHSIDRIDNNSGYSKENCKWSTDIEQANNKRNNVKILNTETGEIYSSISEAARKINMNSSTLHNNLSGKVKNKTKLIKL